jgi:hypothetical protein
MEVRTRLWSYAVAAWSPDFHMKRWVPIVVGVGFLHRFVFIGARQLWTDELMQARIIRSASPAEILTRLRDGMDLASPLDFLIQRAITLLLGDALWAMRLHALVFGTAAIWVFYRLACLLFGARVALYSTILFAFYPLACRYSQEARPYSLLLLLSLLSYDILLRHLYGGRRSWYGWLPVAGISALLLYTSYLGALILISQLIGLALSALWKLDLTVERGQKKETGETGKVFWPQLLRFSLAVLAALALFYPWMRFTWERPNLASVSEIADPKLVLRLIKELGDNSYPVAGLLILGAAAGVCALLRHRRGGALTWLATWFLVPIPLLLGVELWAGYFFAIRHVLHVTPPLVFLAGYGLFHIGKRLTILPQAPSRTRSAAIVFAAALILASVWINCVHAHHEPADWRGVSTFLDEIAREGDAVSMPGVYALLEYYHPGLAAYRSDDLNPGPGSLLGGSVDRRVVVCYDMLQPDPCAAFRPTASRDSAWLKRQFKGFVLFLRSK